MTKLVAGKITGIGPVKTAPYPNGADIAFLAYDDTPKPSDLPSNIPFLHALPMDVVVDMDSLAKNWVKFTPKVCNQDAWCELPRFTLDVEPPIPPAGDMSTLIIDWVNRTVTVKPK